MSPIIFLAAFFAATYLYIYLKTADHIRRKHSQRAYPRYEPRAAESLPPKVRQRFAHDVLRLEPLGFAFVTYLHHAGLPEENGRADVYIALLRNDETGDTVTVGEFFTRITPVGSHKRMVKFETEFEGGRIVCTTNTSSLGVFKPDPRRVTFPFPGVQDMRYLYRLHRALVERHAPGRKGLLASPGLEVLHLCETEARALMTQVECGYFYVDEARGMCRHTWKGALVMTGKLMYGVREVRVALRDRRVRATLKSLGLRA